jgi:hypothetical protein
LTPLEAAPFGKPSSVLRWGGFLDTVAERETGIFFDSPTPDSVVESVRELRGADWWQMRFERFPFLRGAVRSAIARNRRRGREYRLMQGPLPISIALP